MCIRNRSNEPLLGENKYDRVLISSGDRILGDINMYKTYNIQAFRKFIQEFGEEVGISPPNVVENDCFSIVATIFKRDSEKERLFFIVYDIVAFKKFIQEHAVIM